MTTRITSDESLQVLLFVCVPLLLLLIIVIVALIRGSRRTAVFPTFSVSISRVGRQETYVSYRDGSRQLEFDAETRRGERFFTPEIHVRIPKEMLDEDLPTVVRNLACGLANLHYQYLIYRKGQSQEIPEEERNAAITELRQMGVEIQNPQEPGQVQRAVVSDWRHTVGKRASVVMPRLRELMSKARGFRENIEILARSQTRE